MIDYSYVSIWLGISDKSSNVTTIKNHMLNALLISKEYSKYEPKVGPSMFKVSPTYEKIFLELQKEAQDKRIGIWNLPKNSPEKQVKSSVSVYLGENRVLIDPNDNDDEELSQTVNVMITPKCKKYHYVSCRTVKGKYTVLTVAQASKRGYKPCKVCSPPSR